MRDDEHQNDPHTMIIDGRDISVDGSKLDTIESGAEVNNLTDPQAQSLTSGNHSNWHTHDDWYYRKSNLSTVGESSVNWGNLTNVPNEFSPTTHTHDNRYYTEDELDDGALDSRYFTENEIETNYYSKIELDDGQLDNRYYTQFEVDSIISNFYTKTELNNGQLNNLYYTESEIDSLLADKANKIHNHDTLYYTKTILDSGQLDNRYFTEREITTNYYNKSEVDSLVASASYGISGSVNVFSDLPVVTDEGLVYIVQEAEGTNEEGFYRWDGSSWVWLAHNVGGIHHNDLLGLNNGDYQHLTLNQLNTLTTGSNASNLHIHDTRYYTETEMDGFLSDKSDIVHIHDDRYYTETEVDNIISDYYTKTELNTGSLDDRYFTESEITSNYYKKSELDAGQLDVRYYTETEIDGFLSGKSNVNHTHDDIYYTEGEVDATFSLYFTKTELLNGSIDDRYYAKTELNNGILDSRYYTEGEVDSLIASAAYGISGSVDTYEDLIDGTSNGEIFIVKQDSPGGGEGFYRWDGTDWIYLAPNTGGGTHNELGGLNDGDFKHLTSSEYSTLTGLGSASSLHGHDDRYYTESEIDGFLSDKANLSHTHDDRYYTETEIDSLIANYYTENELNSGQLDNRYYTETELDPSVNTGLNVLDARYFTENEIISNYYTKNNLNNGALDFLYYTKNEIDALTSLYYSRSSLNDGILDSRYYTESEVDTLFLDYYTKNQLDTGVLDSRYFTESEITSNYYTKSNLNSGQLDNRYYTESEIDSMIAAIEAFGIKGSVQLFNDLPSSPSNGDVYIVRETSVNGDEGFYKWSGSWDYLAPNTGNVEHNSLQGLNVGDYQHLTSNQLSELTANNSTTIHNHNTTYYTQTQLDDFLSNKSNNGHTHDDLYYTETEIDNLLSGKSGVGHTHDDLYYTKTESDNFLADKADINHNHDSRYFTQTQITSNYFSKSQLKNGQLDNRYYTETEVDGLLLNKSDDGHIHDDRYYTEIESDNLLSEKSDIEHTHNDLYYTEGEIDGFLSGKSDTGHLHDDRYYTESELHGVGGANRIGLTSISGLSSSKVQGALEELVGMISSSSSNLQEAYDNGNTINTSDSVGPVILNGGTTPALEITNKSSTPNQNVSAGSISVIDNQLYIYDGGRSKWLTPSKLLTFGRNNADGHKLSQADVFDWDAGYNMIKDGTIIGFSLFNTRSVTGKDVNILIDDVTVKTLSTTDGLINKDSLNIDFNSSDKISIYVGSSGQPLKDVVATIEISWRK